MTAAIIRADARNLPLPDSSVDLICTSPPYFGLRSYTDGGEHYAGQIGSEATPREYVAALLDCTREWVRVLKPSGSVFVNLGDKYSGAQAQNDGRPARGDSAAFWQRTNPKRTGIPAKSLMGLPWRYALGCIDDLGLILRAEIIWAKVNSLPESVQDRVRRSHEVVFHFTRQPRYYSAVDEVREPHLSAGDPRWLRATKPVNGDRNDGGMAAWRDGREPNPLGKLPGSVWEIASQPLTVPASLGTDHFAAYPMELPRRIIAGWSPPGICTRCGEGRRPVADRSEKILHRPVGADQIGTRMVARGPGEVRSNCGNVLTVHRITGYACACPQPDAPTRPALVVDPFGGTGTTALVADALGRTGLSFDRSADYCRLARWRTADPGERAKARQVPKPPPVMDGQDALFAV